MDERIWFFLAGIGTGMFIYRLYITAVLGRFPETKCDYCEYQRTRKPPRK